MSEAHPERLVTFTPTAENLKHVYRLSLWRQSKTSLWRIGLVLIPVAIIAAAFIGRTIEQKIILALGFWLFWTVLMVVAVAVRFFSLGKATQRIFAQQRLLQEVTTLQWSEASIEIKTDHSYTNLPWDYFMQCRENDHAILLYQSQMLFNFIPKSALTPEQSADIMHLARAGCEANKN